jgi:uncharacterized lipoprotein YbaY/heat shock protein HslJ
MNSKSLRRMLQTLKSSRVRNAAIFAGLVLVLLFGVVQASGPMGKPMPPHPPKNGGGMWGNMPNCCRPQWPQWPPWMPWVPTGPVPTIKIVAVVEDYLVVFETHDFPEDEVFTVTMGEMYTRGVNGIEVGSFNSSDGTLWLAFTPDALYGRDRIAIRASTDHQYPYYAFNWFWNNTAIAPEYTALQGMSADDIKAELEGLGAEGLLKLDSLEAPLSEGVAAEPMAETEEAPAAEEVTEETEAEVTEETATTEETEAETTEGVGGAEAVEEAMAGSELTGTVWQWVGFSDPVQGALTIDMPEQYTVEFMPEGLAAVKADCNNGSGTYIADEEGGLDIAIGIVTTAACAPESLSDQFLQYLGDVVIYSFDDTGLILDLPLDSGTLTFVAAEEAEVPAEEVAEEPAEETTEEAAEETTEEAVEEPTEEAAEATEEGEMAAASVTGTVTYLQRIALPDDAVVKVQIYNASLADATEVLGEQIIENSGQQVPIPFDVAYNPDDINENLMYSVSARIEDSAENLLFISDTVTPVITQGNPTEDVEIMTVQVQASPETEATTEEEAEATAEPEAEATEESESMTPEETPALTGVVWTWTEFTDAVQGTLPIENPEQYTVEFMDDGTVGIKADCNNGSGSFVAEDAGTIDITVGAVTLALCEPDSLSDQFLQYLDAAAIYSFDEGDLLLDLPVDSGTLRLAAAAAEEAGATAKLASITAVPVLQDDNGDEEDSPVPSFTVCAVVRGETVTIEGENFPADQTFTVKMGVPQVANPMYPKQMPMGPMKPEMGQPMGPMRPEMGQPMGPMQPEMGQPMGPMKPEMGQPMGPMKPGMGMWTKPQPKIWIPYYEAGTLETGDGGAIEGTFDIPAQLAGAYKINMLLITDHQFPYMSYNWFYNNDAEGFCDTDNGA